MTAAQFISRLTEVERITIRAATTDDAIVGLYYTYRAELPGSALHGGTKPEGIETMKEVHRELNATFAERSKHPGFPRGWGF